MTIGRMDSCNSARGTGSKLDRIPLRPLRSLGDVTPIDNEQLNLYLPLPITTSISAFALSMPLRFLKLQPQNLPH